MTEIGKRKRQTKLNDKQKRFVVEYLKDCNALQACIRAGYSPKWAYTSSPRLRKNPLIAAAIEQGLQKQRERVEITADAILEDLRILSKCGEKDADKIRALELIGKHLRLFPNSMEHSIQGDLSIKINIVDLPNDSGSKTRK